MNLFTISPQTVTSECRESRGTTSNLRRYAGWLLAALTGVVMAFSAPQEAYAQTFTGGAVTINSSGGGTPFPSAVVASGVGTVTDITVTLTNLSHTWPSDIDIVLESPSGATSIIIADRIGGSGGISGRTYTFVIGGTPIPTTGFPASGTYGVAGTSYGNATPAGPHTANLGNFIGTNGDGTWNLYVHDDALGDGGSLGSWSITLTGGAACAVTPPACATDLGAVATVQNDDPFCCDNAWDSTCQAQYDALSSTCTTNDLCILADPISCGDTVSGTTVGATVDTAPSCGTAGSVTAPGVWYLLSGSTSGDPIVASLCTGTAYDSKISVYSGSCGSLVCVNGNDDACSLQSETSWTSDGSDYYILVHGFSSSTGAFTLNVSCGSAPSCAATPDPCVDTASPEYATVIATDPFCCDNTWDLTCQSAYDAISTTCTGPVCAAVPDPCVDTASPEYATVIATDPFCCDNTWDLTCQNAYDAISTTCTGPVCAAVPDPCVDTASPEYATVIATDPFCCDNTWDLTCQNAYDAISTTCTGPVCATTPPACVDTASPEYATVVTDDPFCCNTTWDSICQADYDALNPSCLLAPIAWCSTATTIGCGASVSGSTVGAPTDPIPGSVTCGTTNGSGGKVAFIYSGIGEDVIADLSGSSYDTKIWVYEYTGSCASGDLVCVGGDDDGGTGTTSRFQFFGASGQDYLIVVGGFSSFEGSYVLDISCGPFGCTDPSACNFDSGAATDDGSCFYVCNDVAAGAVALAITELGTCSPTSGDLIDATTGSGNVGSGVDLWYSFTAVTSGVRVEVVGTAFDAVIELRNMDESPLGPGSTEDVTFTNGTEILNFSGLTAGQDYLVRVGAWSSFGSGSRPFDVCIQFLPDTQCDYAVGVTTSTRSLCQNAKADWVAGATNYIFHFTPQLGGATITYETGAAFTIAPLSNIPGLVWDTAYDVEIDLDLSLTNGAGSSENITVLSSGACELVITPAPTSVLRASDNLTNAGPLPLGRYIAATPFVCTAIEWEWVFSNTNGSQLPITHFSGSSSRFLRLFDVDGLNPGDVYDVEVRPVFATGYVGDFGAVDQIAIIGALGMGGEITSPVANTEIDERVEDTLVATGVALYPNPNRGDFVNVNIANVAEGVDRVIFDLYDLTGKRVISEQIAVAGSGVNVVMPLNGLADGMYIANIIIGEEVHTERIAVQK